MPGPTMRASPPRRSDGSDSSAFTVKELVLRLDAKLDAYVGSHALQHGAEQSTLTQAVSDVQSSAAGRALLASVASVKEDLGDHEQESSRRYQALASSVASHEKTIQRLVGAMALIVFLGGGAFILAAIAFIARIAGVEPI